MEFWVKRRTTSVPLFWSGLSIFFVLFWWEDWKVLTDHNTQRVALLKLFFYFRSLIRYYLHCDNQIKHNETFLIEILSNTRLKKTFISCSFELGRNVDIPRHTKTFSCGDLAVTSRVFNHECLHTDKIILKYLLKQIDVRVCISV